MAAKKNANQKKLSDKQKQFALEYLVDLNATQAAIRAGYSSKTAGSQGERLLKNVEIENEINRLKMARAHRTQVNSDWVLTHLQDMLEADVADIISDTGEYLPIKEWPLIWRQMIQGVDVKELFEGQGKDRQKVGEVIKIKFIDRLRAVGQVGDHIKVQAFNKQVTVTDPEAFSQRLAKARQRAAEATQRMH